MRATTVRADYDRLNQSAGDFGRQAADLRRVLVALKRQAEALQAGDWLGEGAQAFYAEMNGQILPTFNRLVGALEAAADTTRRVNQTIQQAEADAAACLRASGTGNGAGGSGPGATIAAAAAGVGVGGAGAPGGAAAGANATGAEAGVPEGASGFIRGPFVPGSGSGAPVPPPVKGFHDTEGKQAYARYLREYEQYLLQQSQAWTWKDIEARAAQHLATDKQLTEHYDKHVAPLRLESLIKNRRGISDPALNEKLLDRDLEYNNLRDKALVETRVARQRGEELFQQYAQETSKGGVTDAERQELHRRYEQMQQFDQRTIPFEKWDKAYYAWLESIRGEK